MMNRRATVLGLMAVSISVLAVGWAMDAHRLWEGPVEIVVAPGYGLHRMDVIVLALALVPWIGILAAFVWPKRRP